MGDVRRDRAQSPVLCLIHSQYHILVTKSVLIPTPGFEMIISQRRVGKGTKVSWSG